MTAEKYPEITCQAAKGSDGKFVNYSYKDFYNTVIGLALAFKQLNVQKGENVALISDNRREWLLADMGLLSLGAVDVPRGCDSMAREITYIISFSNCRIAIFENEKQFYKITESDAEMPDLKTVILFDCNNKADAAGMDLIEPNDNATMIYTSGTTGTPKGVMLTHRNYISQCEVVKSILPVQPGEMWLSVLPVWHVFERMCEYVILSRACAICYSKPIGSILLADFQKINPQLLPAVPRVFEAVYEGVLRQVLIILFPEFNHDSNFFIIYRHSERKSE